MKYFVVFLIGLPVIIYGNFKYEIGESVRTCCDFGTEFAYNGSSEDCSSAKIHVSPSCNYASELCCQEYNIKKSVCDKGIQMAKTSQLSMSLKTSIENNCFDQCILGSTVGKLHGITTCNVILQRKSAEHLLFADAFSQCCKTAATDAHGNPKSTRNKSAEKDFTHDGIVSSMPSICEEFSPYELCSHHCIPVPGSYKCECNPGFELMSDGRSCQEMENNRCDSHNTCQHECMKIGMEIKCFCRKGYQLMTDKTSCEDINECALGIHDCDKNGAQYQCINIPGSYNCEKRANILSTPLLKVQAEVFYSTTSEIINPTPTVVVSPQTASIYFPSDITTNRSQIPTLLEKPGSLMDQMSETMELCCNQGTAFARNHTSDDCSSSVAPDVPPAFASMCVFAMDQCCKEFVKKSDTKCPHGMRLNPATKICDDIDECVEGTHLCDQYQNCLNTNGSHECHCKLGFELDSTTGACVDINECANKQNNCIPESQQCDNTVGSFLCIRLLSCGTGYITHQSSSTCEDIDECALGTHNCDRAGPQYQCVNIPGSFRCQKRVTTPAPEYDYEYYDSKEEIEASPNATVSNIITTTKLTSTAIIPAQTASTPIINALPEEPKVESDLKNINNPELPGLVEKTENTLDNDIIINTIDEPEQLEPAFRERNRSNEFIPNKPTISQPEKTKPYDIVPKFVPTASTIIKPNPTEKEKIHVVSEVTDVSEVVTSPTLVILNASEETATVKGQKFDDGSVVVDTKKILGKNEWTIIIENPTECAPGFEKDSYGSCLDIDECATNRHSCSGLTQKCQNTIGGYLCDCAYGFRRDLATGACTLITTSSTTSTSTTTTPSTTSSTSTTPVPTTSSTEYYYWGYPDQRITSRPFKPRNTCDVGYYLNSKTGKCEDINECTNGQATCASVEICVNTDGGYRCECPPNWTFDLHRNLCVQVWGAGRFPPGYGNIPDIDECATGEALCGPLQVCTNIPGGYTCSCPAGHKLVGDHVCEDVDECALGGSVPICSQNADCINTVGSYQCRCQQGFKTDPINNKVCVDVDECTDSRPGTLCQHRCNNVWGSYRCSCHRGYRLNPADNRTCTDVDECTELKHKNLCIGRCLNEPGSYRCSCPSGYRLAEDKRRCTDIDECETGEAPCASGGQYEGSSVVCLNIRGGYRCQRTTCPPGYKLENRHRCTKIQNYCPPTDRACSHQPSTYSYNYITFVSNLNISKSKVDLFTMNGPSWPYAKMTFELRFVDVDAPPSVKEKADINAFLLTTTGNLAVISLVRSLEGPQSIELELTMELYNSGQFGGIAVAKIYIYVSEYEF